MTSRGVEPDDESPGCAVVAAGVAGALLGPVIAYLCVTLLDTVDPPPAYELAIGVSAFVPVAGALLIAAFDAVRWYAFSFAAGSAVTCLPLGALFVIMGLVERQALG